MWLIGGKCWVFSRVCVACSADTSFAAYMLWQLGLDHMLLHGDTQRPQLKALQHGVVLMHVFRWLAWQLLLSLCPVVCVM